MKKHTYTSTIVWTGNKGQGTQDYRSYTRNHDIMIDGKYDTIKGSSDPAFLGDPTKYNPEDLFLSSLSACHMLWYLHLCASNQITVIEYIDQASGTLEMAKNGSGQFTEVTLNPSVTIADKSDIEKANELHKEANKMCFIANSCNFIIKHNPKTVSV
ncbi:OsmC family protein [Aquimarina brevivitae]|uniref:Organic hydroperoxide reductase OsmC/OhrA n=1 Tax=Aquimarina brevivitae TaxID=323412 RepID=A0A4Q7P251_9FLAO|nr:OsmC family protein [Aquimarina brevivitae]RZS93951.1 organic hydroperoxide reductase OsmC/OhrA [Aquimarina brevivitae]